MSKINSGASFFQRFFNTVLGKNDPEAAKKKQLKVIAKNLSKTKYKFYKVGSDQMLPAFGKLIFDLYKALAPSQTFFQSQQNPNYYKHLVVDYSLSEGQKKVLEELTEESIRTLSSKMKLDELSKKVKSDLDVFCHEFDKEAIAKIDALYMKLMNFKQISMFDFYFIIKKFDSSIKEGDFSRTPDFKPIDASYVSDDLKDFLTILLSINFAQDWSDLMNMFRAARGTEPVNPSTWGKITSKLNQIKMSKILDMIIQLTTKDPFYIPTIDEKKEPVVEPYIEKIKNDALETLRELENQLKSSKIDGIATQIFSSSNLDSLKYYNGDLNANVQRRGIEGFAYIQAMTYLKHFLVEFVKKEVRSYSDLVIIRGKWVNQALSQEMSSSFNSLMEAGGKVIEFDAKHADDGEFGARVKTYNPRADRDKEAQGMVRRVVQDSDMVGKELIINITKLLISYGKSTKALIEDYRKKKPEMITNWKEIERFSDTPIEELGVEVYKKIYLMVNLMQNYLA